MLSLFKRSKEKHRSKELPAETRRAVQERINSLRAENKALREELDFYKSREHEIVDALNFARERANEYLKEARIRFGLEAARLNDFRARITKRLEKLGSAERVGEELAECERFFAAAAKELDELASGKRVKHTPEEEYRREIERLETLGKDVPVTEPVKTVPQRFPAAPPDQKPAPAEVFGVTEKAGEAAPVAEVETPGTDGAAERTAERTAERAEKREEETVRVRTAVSKNSGEIPKSIFDRHPQPNRGIGTVSGELFPDLVRDVVRYAEKLGYREDLSCDATDADCAAPDDESDPGILSVELHAGSAEEGETDETADETADENISGSPAVFPAEFPETTVTEFPDRRAQTDAKNDPPERTDRVCGKKSDGGASRKTPVSQTGYETLSVRKKPVTLSDDELSGLLAQVYREADRQ